MNNENISKEQEYNYSMFINILVKIFPDSAKNCDLVDILEYYHNNRKELLPRLIKLQK